MGKCWLRGRAGGGSNTRFGEASEAAARARETFRVGFV